MQKDGHTLEESRATKRCVSEGVRRAGSLGGIPSPSSRVLLGAGFCLLPGCPWILCIFGTWIASLPFGSVSNPIALP